MQVKEFKRITGWSLQRMAEECKEFCPGVDAPLISKMCSGLIEPSPMFSAWMEVVATEQEYERKDLSDGLCKVLELLQGSSKTNPVTRSEICEKVGIVDSEARNRIRELRRNGFRIMSTSRVNGYWLGKDDEYKEFRNELKAKAITMLMLISAMDNKPIEGQQRIGD